MQVSVLLQTKGSEVVTIRPDLAISEVLEVLATHHIGAVVVADDGGDLLGVVSERDIVRALAQRGADALGETARQQMCTDLVTCQPDTTVEQLMATMTDRRVRHVPVLADGRLAGIVSIGDVVKDRIDGLEHETQVLHDYIAHPY